MEEKTRFPQYVVVRADSPQAIGLAVSLSFHMNKKNDFNYIVFLDANGQARVSQDELLEVFDKEGNVFLMDYANPRTAFTGKVSALILNASDIQQAFEAYQRYKSFLVYPDHYEDRLKAAIKQCEHISSYHLEVDIIQ